MTDEINTRPMCWGPEPITEVRVSTEYDSFGACLEAVVAMPGMSPASAMYAVEALADEGFIKGVPPKAQCHDCADCPDFPYATDGGYDANGSPVLEFPNSETRRVPVRSYPRNDGLAISYNMLSLPKCTCGYQVGHKWGKHTQVAAGDKVDDEVAVSMECLICGVKVSLVVPGKL